jgi:hypothetical protein
MDLARKDIPITIERQQRIFQELEPLKIESITDPNKRIVIPIAPGDIGKVFQPHHARVVAMLDQA